MKLEDCIINMSPTQHFRVFASNDADDCSPILTKTDLSGLNPTWLYHEVKSHEAHKSKLYGVVVWILLEPFKIDTSQTAVMEGALLTLVPLMITNGISRNLSICDLVKLLGLEEVIKL